MSFFYDLNFVFTWWFVIFTIGIIFLPLTISLFSKFVDRGYLFSKIIGICLISYFIFVSSSFHILKFSLSSIFVVIGIFCIVNILIFLKNKSSIVITFHKIKKIIFFEELLFALILFSWSYVRGLAPNIEGLEKFMDWGFMNTMMRSEYMPPVDMWYSGSPINYYYFGQFYFTVLTKISGISTSISYNLSIATLCALTFSLSFSLILNLLALKFTKTGYKKIVYFSLIGSILLTFSGNLHPLYSIFRNGLNLNSISQNLSKYWYPNATRFIGHDPITQDKTIHEFPVYSFIVSDLHGHVNDIPIVILFLAICLSFLVSNKKFASPTFIFISSLILSWAYTTNAWDFAIYGLFFAILSLLSNKKISTTIITGVIVIVLWYVWSLPFSRNFIPMTQGVSASDTKSPLYQLLILYGGFLLILLPFIFYKKKKDPSTIFCTAAVLLGITLIIIPEFVYVKDIYAYDYRRANTMFKLAYQAFILFSISVPYCFLLFFTEIKNKIIKNIYKIVFIFVFICHASYIFFALPGYYFYKSTPVYKGLNGLVFLLNGLPYSYDAVIWINKNITGQPVILEASGDSYTTFNHISASTGLPTPIGWLVHEWLWRNGYDAPAARQEDVKNMYTTRDFEQFKKLIEKYHIQYIYLGTKEFEKYQDINIDNFNKISAKVVFESGQTKIYQLPF